ncbi:cobalamin biosynthesis protein [Nocardia aurantia]|uniref:Cobalt-precorrin-5A hydrolase n=1 Tax=Nocardia aurantia TaxID=2585199 RepID=A0A7K0E0U8_9NOCA|nr:cobalamin biosynthesis protein [Nocardia aurantia]MQY30734.1 Cobalt-precorrin-5A hydrolase [Nocardia aurantia]
MTPAEPAHRDPDREGEDAQAPLSVGIGFRPGVSASALLSAVRESLGDNVIRCLATIDRRAGEPGLVAAAAALGVPVVLFTAAELAAVPVAGASARVAAAVGTASVAEAAALLAAAGGELVLPKRVVGGVTVAAAH